MSIEFTPEVIQSLKKALEKKGNEQAEQAVAATGQANVNVPNDPASPAMDQHRFISKDMLGQLSSQYTAEMYSSEIYKGISMYCRSIGLEGFAKYYMDRAVEEAGHAKKFYEYVDSVDELLMMAPIPECKTTFGGILEVAATALGHEKWVTTRIKQIADLAAKSDLYTLFFIEQFLKEQIQEENDAKTLLQRVQMADTGAGILFLDHELKG